MRKRYKFKLIFLLILKYSISTFAEYQVGVNYGISEYIYKNPFDNEFNSNLTINYPIFINFDWSFANYFGTQSRIGIIKRETKEILREGKFDKGRLVLLDESELVTSNYFLFFINKMFLRLNNRVVSPYMSIGLGFDYYLFTYYKSLVQHDYYKQNKNFKKLFLNIEPEIGIEKILNKFVLKGCIGFNKNITDVYKDEFEYKAYIIYGTIGVGYIFQSNRKER